MNICVFSGNLGRDPEVKNVGQHTVAEFPIAVRSGFGDKESTFWVRCALWNRDKLAQYLAKGKRVTVSGELSNREFEKRDGGKGYSLELRVASLDLPPKDEQSQRGQAQAHPEPAQQRQESDDMGEVPF
jgi:single-strand DNA-binding protein